MANRYEVIDEDTGEVILPACGNVSLEAWFFSSHGAKYDMNKFYHAFAFKDKDCNDVHVRFARLRKEDECQVQ